MRTRKLIFLLLPVLTIITTVGTAQFVLARPAQAPGPEALFAAVNDFRTENGLSAWTGHDRLFASAQEHSNYQAALGSWTHTGADGSDETQRAIAAGYVGSAVRCDEAVAITTSPERAIELWQDAEHLQILLNSNYTEAGAGATERDGFFYYTLVACTGGSADTVSSSGQAAQAPTATGSRGISPVATVTPQADGGVIHTVQPGESLYLIAEAYGISVAELMALNGLDNNSLLYVNDTLIIRAAPTATATSDATATLTPTRTQRPTRTSTPRPTSTNTLVPTITPTVTLTPTPQPAILAIVETVDPLLAVIGLLAVVGAVMMLVGSVLKGKK